MGYEDPKDCASMNHDTINQNLAQQNRDFKGIWTPREIWYYPNLSRLAKSLWAEIDSLYCPEHGGCYASNEYLADFCTIKERQLQNLIKELKDANLLEEVSFNGRKRVLKALNPYESTSTGQTRNILHPRGAIYCTSPIYKEYNKDKNKDKKYKKEKEPEIPKKAYRDHVLLSEDEFMKLKEVYGDWLDRGLDKLEYHKSVNGGTYKSDYAVFKVGGWLHDTFIKESNSGQIKGIPGDVKKHVSDQEIMENRKLSNSIAETYWKLKLTGVITAYGDRIVISSGKTYIEIMFNEFSFKDKVINQLRKLNLPIDGL